MDIGVCLWKYDVFGISYGFGMAALVGYELFKGRVTEKTYAIIIVVTLIWVVISSLIVIPLLELYTQGYMADWSNFKLIYSYPDIRVSFLKDLVIGVVFAVLSVSGVKKHIDKKINPVIIKKPSMRDIIQKQEPVVEIEEADIDLKNE